MSRDTPSPSSLLCFQLYATNHAFNRLYQDLLAPIGLTYPQYLVLLALNRRDEQMVGELAEELFLESNTLSPLLKRMETMGILKRHRSVNDERKVIVSLTDQGKSIAAEAVKVPACVADAIGLPIADLKTIADLLVDLRQRLIAATH